MSQEKKKYIFSTGQGEKLQGSCNCLKIILKQQMSHFLKMSLQNSVSETQI